MAPRAYRVYYGGPRWQSEHTTVFLVSPGPAVLATFRVPGNSLMPNVTHLAERLLATDDVAKAQAIAKELRAAIQTRIVREKAHLMSYLITPPSKNGSGAT